MGDGGSAAEAYERVLELDPLNFTASTELENLYRQRKLGQAGIDRIARPDGSCSTPWRGSAGFTQMAEETTSSSRRSRRRPRWRSGSAFRRG